MIKLIARNVFSAKKMFVDFYFYPVLFINLFFAYIKSYKCQVYLFNYPPHRCIWVIFGGGGAEMKMAHVNMVITKYRDLKTAQIAHF